MKFTCPCCGIKSMSNENRGTIETCEICFWHNDFVQFQDPNRLYGANDVSLRQAQHNYMMFGASQEIYIPYVRKPSILERATQTPFVKRITGVQN
ncbi:CPCC family cysteine-rich protein [Brevibacillus reuszeri]|uniref:CPCC family cysteine-rich protein n=1 Tax=Brevibacillus reuszeri TaxID=54915 RepID=UPI003D24FA63